MARAPDPRVEEAKKLFDDGLKLIEIANRLDIPEGTVRSWKNRYNWDNATLQKKKCNVAKKRGGQPGNQNAVGNRGGAAPVKNKNAVTTGEFETLFFGCLDLEEKNLVQAMPTDKEELLLQELQLLTVREQRMLKRIENLKQSAADPVTRYELEVPHGMTLVSYKGGIEKGKLTDLNEFEGILGQIQAIEDALTRVQSRKQKAIDSLHRFGIDDARLELETMKFELELLKQGGQDNESGDDGFLDALNVAAQDVWGDEDEE